MKVSELISRLQQIDRYDLEVEIDINSVRGEPFRDGFVVTDLKVDGGSSMSSPAIMLICEGYQY